MYTLIFAPQYTISEQYLEISLERFKQIHGISYQRLYDGRYLVVCYGNDLADEIENAADKNGCLLVDRTVE